MYKLTDEFIKNNFAELTCGYSENGFADIISFDGFEPQSFTVAQKKRGLPILYFNDITYEEWVGGIISDQLMNPDIRNGDIEDLYQAVFDNIEKFLDYAHDGAAMAEQIYNQEFVDIIRKVLAFTLFGDLKTELHPAKAFNSLADSVMPLAIRELSYMRPSEEEVFRISVASGLSGLDLKGAPSAASFYANEGIAMRPYLNMPPELAAKDYFGRLLKITGESSAPVFDWDIFQRRLSGKGRLVWFTDDYIESYFDLYFISMVLDKYPGLSVELIPKNGRYGNDLSWADLEKMLECPVFGNLREYLGSGRLMVNKYGPKMGAANVRKLSDKCAESMLAADFILLKGCRIHEMLQGGLNAETFSAYIVSRALSEIVTGFDSKELPLLLIHLDKKEYAFFGMHPENAKTAAFSGGRNTVSCFSTVSDHQRRKALALPGEIAEEMRALSEYESRYSGDKTPLYKETDMLSERLKQADETLKGE